MRLIENSTSRKIFSSLNEDFWNPCEYAQMIMNLDIDPKKWNAAETQEERDAMVRPQLEEFWKEYGRDIKEKRLLRRIYADLEDSNFHTEGRILRDIVNKSSRKSKVDESVEPKLSDKDFEEMVKRDFRLFLMDKYGDELYKDVNNDDINEYFTGMFYDIEDNDDLDAANEAERIIRNEYNCLDSRDFSVDYEYDDGDTNWAAEEAADADERFENRYMGGGNGSTFESVKLTEDSKIWSNHGQEEYYQNMTREEMIQEIKNNGWDEEEINGKPILDADDDELREYLTPYDIDLDYEDYEQSILPMIEKQCYGDYIVLCGTAANWRGKGEACKAIKVDDLKDYFFPNYDASIQLYCNNNDDLYYTEANHDTPVGGTEMYLYSFWDETDYNNAEKALQKIYEDEDFDMYYFCDYLGYSDAEQLINSGLLKPIKRDPQFVGITESAKTQDFINDMSADQAAMRYAGITGNDMTLDQYNKYQEYLHNLKKNDTSRYDITISYWDKNGYDKEKSFIGRSVKEIAKKFVAAKDKYDFKEITDWSDNLEELVDNSTCRDLEDYLTKTYKGETIEKLDENDDSYFKGVKILDKVYSNKETEDLWNKNFNKLVPKTGNAETDIGEVMRCFSSLSHAYYQNGDIISRLWSNSGYYQDARDLFKAVKNLGDETLIELVNKLWNTRIESAYAKYLATFYTYFINTYINKDNLTEAKKPKKEDKRVIMQQGNVTCIKENSSYLVFENESDNEVEHDSEESAMQDFLERVGVNPEDELTDENNQ